MKKVMMIALSLLPLSAFAASPQPFNFICASAGGAYSDGQGGVWLQGQPATVKQMSDNYWEARQGKVVLSITRQSDGNPDISFTGPGRAHGACLPEDNRSFAPAAQGPSFSCKGVSASSMEERICKSPELSALDRKMAKTWRAALDKSGNDTTLKATQRGWIKGRDECWKETDHDACIKTQYQQRLGELQKTYGLN
ncbi:lysozyme inhibitor LprI family protein [Kluyvera sp. 142486]|uniref:lysozyme inhibitor LprI family protein n=1 Tax=Kluyvera sp. 142486 TaxID=3390050 RepID=UPI00397FD93E